MRIPVPEPMSAIKLSGVSPQRSARRSRISTGYEGRYLMSSATRSEAGGGVGFGHLIAANWQSLNLAMLSVFCHSGEPLKGGC